MSINVRKLHNHFGLEIIDIKNLGDVKNLKLKLKPFLEENQLILIRNLSLELEELLEITSIFGTPEVAWEDVHPKNKFIQFLDSKTQIKISRKSSSQHWHVDRSFMQIPTRFTFLYAKEAALLARETQILNSRELLQNLPQKMISYIDHLEGWHAFDHKFPNIMTEKKFLSSKINNLKDKYPPAKHPLVRKVMNKKSLYYSELCLTSINNENSIFFDDFISKVTNGISKLKFYEHKWQPGDLLIWDNFSTVHRAKPEGQSGLRTLYRASVGSGQD